jgi:hypothetical protein
MSDSIERQIRLLNDISQFLKTEHNELFNECVKENISNQNALFYINSSINGGSFAYNQTVLNRAIDELELLSNLLRTQIGDVLTPDLLTRLVDYPEIKTLFRLENREPFQKMGKKKGIQRKIGKKKGKKKGKKDSAEEYSEWGSDDGDGDDDNGDDGSGDGNDDGDDNDNGDEEKEEEKEEEEVETYAFIIHGTLDPNDNRIDNDEDLEKRQKYIHDLRYWAWKRFNFLKEFKTSVDWENVEAYFYRHTDDSIWARMFSPPIFWTPIDTIGSVFSKIAQAGIFGKYDFGNTELTESNMSIVRRIAQLIEKKKNVLLYGFSVGGLVVQRICELLNICSYNDDLSKLILGVFIDVEDLNKYFKAATFGSIYIAPKERVDNISIFNYMLIDDVATRTNFFDFGFGYLVPKFEDYQPYVHYICNQYTTILYEYLKMEDTTLIYLQNWNSGWFVGNNKEDVIKKVIQDYTIEELKNLYREHNKKYNLVFHKLVKSRTNLVDDLPETCNRPSTAILEPVIMPESRPRPTLRPIPIQGPEPVRYRDVATTVEELIEDEIHVPESFYDNQDDFIRTKTVDLNSKLKEAEEAREVLESAKLKKESQKSQRDARARRRESLKELRTDLIDLTENGAVELMSRTNSVEAENPEEDMLNFSNILAQLEARSVFLKGDGVKNIRYLMTQAINRGIGHRNYMIRAQGGSNRQNKEPPPSTGV